MWNETWPKNHSDNLEWYVNFLTDEQKDHLLLTLQQDKLKKWPRQELIWNRDAVIKDLQCNYLTIEDDIEKYGQKWKIIHLTLPKVKDFEWFNFSCFISDKPIYQENLKYDITKNLFSRKDITNLFIAINEYMKIYLETDNEKICYDIDHDTNYEELLTQRDFMLDRHNTCKAWEYLKKIMWLNDDYWLSNNDYYWFKNIFVCKGGQSTFRKWWTEHWDARVLTKI